MTAIRFRRGAKAAIPASAPSGTPLWCEDSKEFYNGTDSGVQKIGSNGWTSMPIGAVFPWTSTTIPDGHIECNGQAVSRTTYSELFEVIGTSFGSGNGSTTFNVPDLRAEFIRGLDRGRGADINRLLGSAQADAFQGHWHQSWGSGGSSSGGNFSPSGQPWSGGTKMKFYNTTNNTTNVEEEISNGINGTPRIASETRPRNVALIFIIKAKNITFDATVQNANADTVDGCHAGNAANNVLKLDDTGKVPLTNLPASDAVPAGTVSFFTKNTPPTGYLKCNGAAISRTTYSTLFAAIGTTFGTGDGSTTFNLPDLRGEFIRGWDDTRGIDTGRTFGSYQADELKLHNHTLSMYTAGGDNPLGGNQRISTDNSAIGGPYIPTYLTMAETGGTETRPRNRALLPCIKY